MKTKSLIASIAVSASILVGAAGCGEDYQPKYSATSTEPKPDSTTCPNPQWDGYEWKCQSSHGSAVTGYWWGGKLQKESIQQAISDGHYTPPEDGIASHGTYSSDTSTESTHGGFGGDAAAGD